MKLPNGVLLACILTAVRVMSPECSETKKLLMILILFVSSAELTADLPQGCDPGEAFLCGGVELSSGGHVGAAGGTGFCLVKVYLIATN